MLFRSPEGIEPIPMVPGPFLEIADRRRILPAIVLAGDTVSPRVLGHFGAGSFAVDRATVATNVLRRTCFGVLKLCRSACDAEGECATCPGWDSNRQWADVVSACGPISLGQLMGVSKDVVVVLLSFPRGPAGWFTPDVAQIGARHHCGC